MARKKGARRETKKYDPHGNELGFFGTVLLIVMGCVMLAFFIVNMTVFVFGEKTKGTPFTKLVDGEVVAQDSVGINSEMYYTFRDQDGVLHEGSSNLLGSSGELGSTVTIFYLPSRPERSILSMKDGMDITTLGTLALGVILIGAGEDRLRKLRKKKRGEDAEEAAEADQAVPPDTEPVKPDDAFKRAFALAEEEGGEAKENASSQDAPRDNADMPPDSVINKYDN